jgi:hypothetical protein
VSRVKNTAGNSETGEQVMSMRVRKILAVGWVAATVALILTPRVNADENSDIQAQCQREAKEYGIEPEQLDQYISGCVLAMGGSLAADKSSETEGQENPKETDSPAVEESGAAQ